MKSDNEKKTSKHTKDVEYKENGNNFKAGKPDISPLPNNPAENAERTSPEEDEKAKAKKGE